MDEPVGDGPVETPRRRRSAWRQLLRAVAWVTALLVVLAGAAWWISGSEWLGEEIRAGAAARLSEYLDRPVAIGALRLHLVPLQLEVSDLVIGSDRPGGVPFARVGHAVVVGDLEGLRKPVLTLRSIEVDEPRVQLELRADGSDNIPRPRGRRTGGSSRLEVEIGSLRVRDGVFVLDERRTPISLSARNVRAALLGVGGAHLQGETVAQEVRIVLPDAQPYVGGVTARVALGGGRIDIVSARVAGPELRATARGAVDWSRPTGTEVKLAVVGETAGALLAELGYADRELLQGDLAVDGSFSWNPAAWGFRARVRSPALRFAERRFLDVDGELTGGGDGLRYAIARAGFDGGSLTGSVDLDLRRRAPDGGRPLVVDVRLAGVSLARLFEDQAIPVPGLDGAIAGHVVYRLSTSAPDRGDGLVDVELARVPVGPRGLSLGGPVAAAIERGVVRVPEAELTAPGQTLRGAGEFDIAKGTGSFGFRLATTDAGEVAKLIPVAPEPGGAAPPWLPLEGSGTDDGTLTIAKSGVPAELRLSLADVATTSVRAAHAEGGLRVDGNGVDGLWLELARPDAAAGPGVLRVAGSIPFEDRRPLAVTVEATSWPLAEARPWLPFALPLDGSYSGRVELAGTLDALHGSVGGVVRPALLAGSDLGELRARLRFDPHRLDVDEAVLVAEAGEVIASGTIDLDAGKLSLLVDAPQLALTGAPISDYLGGVLAGQAAVTATVSGTLDRPAVDAELRARGLVYDGHEVPEEAHVRVRVGGGTLEATGELPGLVAFEGDGTFADGVADAKLRFRVPSIAAAARLALPPAIPEIGGSLAGEATIGWRRGTPVEVAVTVPTLAVRFQGHDLATLEPVRLHIVDGALRVESFYLGDAATESELFVSGTVGLGAPYPLDLRLQSTISAAWLGLALPQIQEPSGSFDVLASVRGTVAEPAFNGQGEIRDGRFVLAATPQVFDHVQATVLLYPRQVVLDSFRANVGGGTVRAGGSVDLFGPQGLAYRLQLSAADLSLRYPEGWLMQGGAELTLQSAGAEGRQIRGVVDLRRAFYLRDVELGLVQLLQRFLGRERLEVDETDELLATTQLNLAIQGEDALRVRNNLANLSGDVQLSVRGTLARPLVFGRIELDEGGTLVYNGTTYDIQRGLLTFANPYRLDPLVDLVAKTKVRDYEVSLELSGTTERLNATFSSNPPLADLDILGLLTTGEPLADRAQFTPGATSTAGQSYAAETFLYGQAASLISNRVNNLFGLDKFRIDPLPASSGSAPTARVTVGKRLSRSIYATYSTDVSHSESQILQVEWNVANNWTLVLTQNGDGSYSVDARWDRTF